MAMTPQLVLMVLKGCGEAHAHEEEVRTFRAPRIPLYTSLT